MANIPSAYDRLAQQRQAASTPMECPRCGGSHFYRVESFQFSNTGHGTAEFKMLSSVPQMVIMCLCGRVIKPGAAPQSVSSTAISRFYDSVTKSDNYQKGFDANGLKQQLAQDFIGTDDFNGASQLIQENFDNLEARVSTVESALESIGSEEPEAETPKVDPPVKTGRGRGAAAKAITPEGPAQ